VHEKQTEEREDRDAEGRRWCGDRSRQWTDVATNQVCVSFFITVTKCLI
jgi:hypothetical protein